MTCILWSPPGVTDPKGTVQAAAAIRGAAVLVAGSQPTARAATPTNPINLLVISSTPSDGLTIHPNRPA
jgi:hypothetical protein